MGYYLGQVPTPAPDPFPKLTAARDLVDNLYTILEATFGFQSGVVDKVLKIKGLLEEHAEILRPPPHAATVSMQDLADLDRARSLLVQVQQRIVERGDA